MNFSIVEVEKKKHTMTVPRDYLESLEEFYSKNMANHYNVRGDVRKVKRIGYEEEKTLFIKSEDFNNIDNVIIIDEEGREKAMFSKTIY